MYLCRGIYPIILLLPNPIAFIFYNRTHTTIHRHSKFNQFTLIYCPNKILKKKKKSNIEIQSLKCISNIKIKQKNIQNISTISTIVLKHTYNILIVFYCTLHFYLFANNINRFLISFSCCVLKRRRQQQFPIHG